MIKTVFKFFYIIFPNFLGFKWKSHRKILSSAFHFGILQNFVSVFHRETDRLVAILKKFEGEEINIVPLAAQFTLYAIAGNYFFIFLFGSSFVLIQVVCYFCWEIQYPLKQLSNGDWMGSSYYTLSPQW